MTNPMSIQTQMIKSFMTRYTNECSRSILSMYGTTDPVFLIVIRTVIAIAPVISQTAITPPTINTPTATNKNNNFLP